MAAAMICWRGAYAINASEDLEKTIQNLYEELQYSQKTADEELSVLQESRTQYWANITELQKEIDKAALVLYSQDAESLFSVALASETLNNVCERFHNDKHPFENWLQTMKTASTRYANIRDALRLIHTENLPSQSRQYITRSVSICDTLDTRFASLRDSILRDQQRYAKLSSEINELENINHDVVNQIRSQIFSANDLSFLDSSFSYYDLDQYYDLRSKSQRNNGEDNTIDNRVKRWENYNNLIALLVALAVGLSLRFIPSKKSPYRSKRWYYAFLVYIAVLIVGTYIMPVVLGLNSFMTHVEEVYIDLFLFIFWMTLSATIRLKRPGLGWSIVAYLPLVFLDYIFIVLANYLTRSITLKIVMPVMMIFLDIFAFIIIAIGHKRILKTDYAAVFSCMGLLLVSTVLVFMGYHYPAYIFMLLGMSVMTYVSALVCIKHFFAKRIRRAGPALRLTLSYLVYPCFYIYALVQSLYDVANVFNLKAWLATQFSTPFVSLPQFGVISVSRILTLLMIGILVNYLIKLVKLILLRVDNDKYGTGSYSVVITLGTMVIWFCFGISALIVLQINHRGVIAAIGGASLGIGFAMKETFENLISGLQLMASRARPGDLVNCDNARGVIKRIGILCTQIQLEDGPIVSFPNRQLLSSSFTNLTLNRRREIRHIVFDICDDSDLDLAKRLMIEASKDLDGVVDHDKHYVVMRNTNSGIVRLDYKCWIDSAHYLRTEPAVREAIFKAFRANGIKIADFAGELGMKVNNSVIG